MDSFGTCFFYDTKVSSFHTAAILLIAVLFQIDGSLFHFFEQVGCKHKIIQRLAVCMED